MTWNPGNRCVNLVVAELVFALVQGRDKLCHYRKQ